MPFCDITKRYDLAGAPVDDSCEQWTPSEPEESVSSYPPGCRAMKLPAPLAVFSFIALTALSCGRPESQSQGPANTQAAVTVRKEPGGQPQSQETGVPTGITVTKEVGGSMKFGVPGRALFNEHSSLNRARIAVHDASMPVDLLGTPGIELGTSTAALLSRPALLIGDPEWDSIVYHAKVFAKAKYAISALEVRFLTFTVAGASGPTLRYSRVADMEAGEGLGAIGVWIPNSERESEECYATIAFVASVRTRDGRLLVANLDPIIAEARQISPHFRPEYLEATLISTRPMDEDRRKSTEVLIGLDPDLVTLQAGLGELQEASAERVLRGEVIKIQEQIALERAKGDRIVEETRLLDVQLDAMKNVRAHRITQGDFTNLTPEGIKEWLGTIDPPQRDAWANLLENELDAQLRREDISFGQFVKLKKAVQVGLYGEREQSAVKK